jgi:soluble lytic murein transglycosylase-like protein
MGAWFVGARRRLRTAPRQLLGLGVVLVTIIPAYAASRMTTIQAMQPPRVAESARSASSLDAVVAEAAARHGVPPNLVMAVIAAESQFDPLAVSRRGALGLMQLMPATARILRVSDPFDPRENIEAGVRHLRAMLDLFDDNLPLALAAYNAGATTVIRHRGVPPYRETRQYVSRILRRLDSGRATSPAEGRRGRRS